MSRILRPDLMEREPPWQPRDSDVLDHGAVDIDTRNTTRSAARSGRHVLEAIAAGTLPPPPAATLLALDLESVGDGVTRFGFDAREAIGNPTAAHGGVLAAIADFAVTTAVWTRLPAEVSVVTADLHVSFLRTIPLDGARYDCTGRVVHIGRSQATATAEIRSWSGELHVLAMATCRMRPLAMPNEM